MTTFEKIKKPVARMNILKQLKKHVDCHSGFPVFNICSNPILSAGLCSKLRKLLESAEEYNNKQSVQS